MRVIEAEAATSSNMPDSTAICGNIETARMVKQQAAPLNRTRPSA